MREEIKIIFESDLFDIIKMNNKIYYCFDEGGSDKIEDLIDYLRRIK